MAPQLSNKIHVQKAVTTNIWGTQSTTGHSNSYLVRAKKKGAKSERKNAPQLWLLSLWSIQFCLNSGGVERENAPAWAATSD